MITLAWIWAIIAVLLLGVLLAFIYYIMPQKVQHYKDENIQLKQVNTEKEGKVKELEARLKELRIDEYKKYVSLFSELIDHIPDFSGKQTHEDRIQNLNDFMDKYVLCYSSIENQKGYIQFAKGLSAGAEAFSMVLKLREMMNYTQQQLQKQETPLDKNQCLNNLDMLLNLAMTTFDLVTTFGNPNIREEQRLNEMLLFKKITIEQALEQAKPMTRISTETPKWIRAIKETLETHGIRRSNVIFSGYKLVE